VDKIKRDIMHNMMVTAAAMHLEDDDFKEALQQRHRENDNSTTKILLPDGTIVEAQQVIVVATNFTRTRPNGEVATGTGAKVGCTVSGLFAPPHFVVMADHFLDVIRKHMQDEDEDEDAPMDAPMDAPTDEDEDIGTILGNILKKGMF